MSDDYVNLNRQSLNHDAMVERGANKKEWTREDQEIAAGKTASILAILQCSRWVHTNELISTTHRFSACIHTLRANGHVIQSRRHENGGYEWKYVELRETCRIGKNDPAAYYRTAHWRRMRLARLEHDMYQCCNCKRSDGVVKLQVHHWRYDLFRERLGDLMTLCVDCHERMHDNLKNHIGFPRRVEKWVRDRIRTNE